MSDFSVQNIQFGHVAKADKKRLRREVWSGGLMGLDRAMVRAYAHNIDNPFKQEMDAIAFRYTEPEVSHSDLETELSQLARRLGRNASPNMIKVFIRQLIDDSFQIPEGSPVINAFIEAYQSSLITQADKDIKRVS